ncbi:glycine-rich domain-containing protein [Kitasatospora sp. NPDC056783]|uniref:glycine-rich domain-containing protein n=1 Tax=Kitasatospora sp. NPDC056783 TaxID=3345943 RepID=UPI0036CA2A73
MAERFTASGGNGMTASQHSSPFQSPPPGPPVVGSMRQAVPAVPGVLMDRRSLDSVVATVLDNNEGMSPEMARRIVHEAISFVVTGALRPELAMAPSRIVDEGWHALVLHTEEYADLCGRFGGFVHHSPGFDPANFDSDILEQTQEAIRSVGFEVDVDLWCAPTDNTLVSVAANCQHAPNCSIRPMKKPEKPCTKPPSVG